MAVLCSSEGSLYAIIGWSGYSGDVTRWKGFKGHYFPETNRNICRMQHISKVCKYVLLWQRQSHLTSQLKLCWGMYLWLSKGWKNGQWSAPVAFEVFHIWSIGHIEEMTQKLLNGAQRTPSTSCRAPVLFTWTDIQTKKHLIELSPRMICDIWHRKERELVQFLFRWPWLTF